MTETRTTEPGSLEVGRSHEGHVLLVFKSSKDKSETGVALSPREARVIARVICQFADLLDPVPFEIQVPAAVQGGGRDDG